MRRCVVLLWAILCTTGMALAQSRTVLPQDLELSVEVDAREHALYTREMVLITIRGVYRRHITREALVQPDLEGFSWTQLGDDLWREERIGGEKVKTFRRRMALYPDRPGRLEIGAFRHKLTLTDEGDDWFEHQIASAPISIDVAAAPETQDWWFPVTSLRISDQWSNAPDQLQSGEGVLRVVRIEALGVTPEMIPPMPELSSPSAMIFPHPEKRLVELTPKGPKTFAYWRWTIRPGNDVSAIVEPITLTYFDTLARMQREVTITAQRVAYGDVTPQVGENTTTDRPAPAQLPGWPMAMVAAVVCLGGVIYALQGYRLSARKALQRITLFDPLARLLKLAARRGDVAAMGRAAFRMVRRDGATPARQAALADLERLLFAAPTTAGQPSRRSPADLRKLAADFLRR